MLREISREMLQQYKARYTPGTRVRLIVMQDPFTRIMPGSTGTVTGVDDVGTIHVRWDCGSSLGVAFGEDTCEIIPE